MELTPKVIVAACAALFGGIIAISMAAQYRDNEEFKARLNSLDLGTIVPRLRREEGLDAPEVDEKALVDRLLSEDSWQEVSNEES